MSDILTTWQTDHGDFALAGTQLASGNDLQTAVILSLFSDRVAGVDDVPSDGTNDPRGWWADDPQRPIGSRLWLLARAKRTQQTLQAAQGYAIEALQWLIEDGVASTINVVASWGASSSLQLQVTVFKVDGTRQNVNFGWAWDQVQNPPVVLPPVTPEPPPSDPYIANVVALLHFEQANGATVLNDSSPQAQNWACVGSSAVSTTANKFGAASLRQAGSGSLADCTGSHLNLNGGDYTVEGWVLADVSQPTTISVVCSTFLTNGAGRMGVLFFDTGAFQVFEQDGSGANNASATSSTGAFTLGAWHHFAAVKHGTDLLLFLDGVQVASTTSAVRSSFPGYMRIGRLDTGGGEFPFAGYVDDFRVTKGVARYVANFTPPVAPFPDA